MTKLVRTCELPVSAADGFRWHARPGAFERLVAPWEHVEIDSPAAIEDGARAHLATRVGPVSARWVAEHKDVRPGEAFTDVQISGPFKSWRHQHRFERDANGSRLVDEIEYRLPAGPLGELFGGAFVEKKLARMFRYRHDVTAADLRVHSMWSATPKKIGVTGSSGLIGSALAPFLTTGGHSFKALPRRPSTDDVEGLDVVIHLAGETIGEGRWTAAKKRRILSSRTEGTEAVARAIAEAKVPPRVFISGSAHGIYGRTRLPVVASSPTSCARGRRRRAPPKRPVAASSTSAPGWCCP
jgi:ligand-binding SRPBCC domain-containing protein